MKKENICNVIFAQNVVILFRVSISNTKYTQNTHYFSIYQGAQQKKIFFFFVVVDKKKLNQIFEFNNEQ